MDVSDIGAERIYHKIGIFRAYITRLMLSRDSIKTSFFIMD
jgi:hypothetical protein